MTVLQAAAAVTLWASKRFNALDIANALGLSEPAVVKILDEVRTWERGPELRVVK